MNVWLLDDISFEVKQTTVKQLKELLKSISEHWYLNVPFDEVYFEGGTNTIVLQQTNHLGEPEFNIDNIEQLLRLVDRGIELLIELDWNHHIVIYTKPVKTIRVKP